MPLSADTGALAPFRFTTFDGRKVVFKSRFLSRRDASKHDAICAEVDGKMPDAPDVREKIRDAIELGIVGWDRSEPYSFDALAADFTDRDLAILAVNYTAAVQLAEIDLGKSQSAQRLQLEGSAGTATGAAPTPPANDGQS